jgi:hypothetical protein
MDWLVVLIREKYNFSLNLHDDSAMCQPSVLFSAVRKDSLLLFSPNRNQSDAVISGTDLMNI